MPTHLHQTLPFLLNRIAARISDTVNKQFRPLGLNVFSARVLILLLLEDASIVGELAEKVALDQTTLSHILRRLQSDGLIQRERLEHDNRSVNVALTARGRLLARESWEAAQAHDKLLRRGLSAAELNVLTGLLVRLYANVPAFTDGVLHHDAAKAAARTATRAARRTRQ